MYYIPIKIDEVKVDALVGTGACLSALPLYIYNTIQGLAGSNILLSKETPVFKETCPVLFSAII